MTDFKQTNPYITPMLTDLYQITMSYSYWKGKRTDDHAVFDLFFRKNPFKGNFTIFAGLEEALKLVSNFVFTEEHIEYLKTVMPDADSGFFDWLSNLNCSKVKIFAIPEGTVVFPRMPLIRVEGPLGVCQLLETPLLNAVNYASLMATNAARFRIAAGDEKLLLEFGLRRAQGPDGAMSASKYSYMGGFHGTSNVLAGFTNGIPIKGTHAHSFVSSFTGLEDLASNDLDGEDFVSVVLAYRDRLAYYKTNDGELAAFISYAQAFPKGFLALVDTYDTLNSGVPNFIAVSLALLQFGYKSIGIRLDSGDLAELSKGARKMFQKIGNSYPDFGTKLIVASDGINEDKLYALKDKGHEIDVFGVGTNLVTCQAQPALGCVFKLVECNSHLRIKLSQAIEKITIPGKKDAYRMFSEGQAIMDLLVFPDDVSPEIGKQILCYHPLADTERILITPDNVIKLHELYWDGRMTRELPSLNDVRNLVLDQLPSLGSNPDMDYKVYVTERMFESTRTLRLMETPIEEILRVS